jgi:hypothetical protein
MLTGLKITSALVSCLNFIIFSLILRALIHDLFGHDIFFTLAIEFVLVYEVRFVTLRHLRLSQKGSHVIMKLVFLIESKLAYWAA